MKRFFLLPILFVSAMMLLADFNEALTYFNATTDKPAVSYKAGDKVVFTFNFGEMNKDIPEGTVISWVREGDDQVFANGDLVWRHDEPVTLETSIGCPGFVHIFAKLKDAATGNDIKFENGNAVTLDCGAGAEPEKLIAAPEPRDFDEYWQKQKEKLAKCPMELLEKKEVLRNNGVVVYAVKISCAPPRPVTGFLGIPENAAEKSLPVYCYYDGYSSHKDIFQQIPKWFANDKISFAVNAHGADLLQDDEYYEQFNKEIKSGDYGYAFDPKQNLSPDTAYFHGMVMRLLRAAEFAKTLPEWDGKTLAACGSSQGGLQSVWAAALDHDFTSAYPTVPWQCDVGARTPSTGSRAPGGFHTSQASSTSTASTWHGASPALSKSPVQGLATTSARLRESHSYTTTSNARRRSTGTRARTTALSPGFRRHSPSRSSNYLTIK